eukprot:g6701.t1
MTIDTTSFQRYHQFTDKKSTGSHEIVRAIDTASASPMVFFAADASCNRRSEELAKVKFSKTPGSKESRELAASDWVNTTCRDIQTAVIKTCAYTNRYSLKCAFGEDYNELILVQFILHLRIRPTFFINRRLITSIYLMSKIGMLVTVV